jgi:hypothetical protein
LTTVLLPLGLAAALVAVPPVATAPLTAAPAQELAAAAPASQTYTTFTLNIKHDLGRKRALADMRKALTLGDAGGFQEMSDLEDRQSMVKLLAAQDWGWYMPRDGGVAIPVVWNRSRFRMIDGRSIRVHGPEEGVTPSRYINVVRLREISTGKVFGYINTHTISMASYDAQASDMHRIPRLRRHLRMLREEIVRLFGSTEHVFVSGDLNVNYLADRRRQVKGLPTDRLGDLVSFDMPLEGSRGPTSLLDYGMTVKVDSGLQLDHSRIVRGFNSDHDAVQLTYRPVDLLANGPLFNGPRGTEAERHRTLNRAARAVMDAEPGALVRVVTGRLDDPALERSLLSAHAEGVDVRIVLGGGKATEAEQRLAAALGADRTAGSWLFRCAQTCLGGSGETETNAVLVSRSGGTTALTLVSSGSFVNDIAGRWSDLFRSSSSSVYDGYGRVFDRMSQDATDTTGRNVRFGSLSAQLYPASASKPRDPVLRALAPVKCLNARGLRTADGRTNVRVSVRTWSGARGLQIAHRLGVLKAHGCDVAALLGPRVKAGVRRSLDRAHIPVRHVAAGKHLLVVDGRYRKRGGAHVAFIGGPSWSDRGLTSDGVTLVVPYENTVRGYLDDYARAWSS